MTEKSRGLDRLKQACDACIENRYTPWIFLGLALGLLAFSLSGWVPALLVFGIVIAIARIAIRRYQDNLEILQQIEQNTVSGSCQVDRSCASKACCPPSDPS